MSDRESPTGLLREEHRCILRVLNVLEQLLDRGGAGNWDFDALDDSIAFFRLFADACHHGKEEGLLFPELEARGMPREGGPIAVMLMEHQRGRAFVAQMARSLERARTGDAEEVSRLANAGRGYITLLRNHILKEDNVLFNMADQIVTGQACQRLCNDYHAVCAHRFEGRSKAELERLAAELETHIA